MPLSQDARGSWDKKWGPLVPTKPSPRNATICHIPSAGCSAPDFHFDHLKKPSMPLKERTPKSLLALHNDRKATTGLISRSCSGCHEDVHKGHVGAGLQKCHSEVNGSPSRRRSTARPDRFPLTGLHATVLCIQCHARADALKTLAEHP